MYEGFDEPDWYDNESYAPDYYFLEAKEDIKDIFNADKLSIYYIRQLQIKLEKKFFHWITYNAVESLISEGFLKPINKGVSEFGTPIQFLVRWDYRYPQRRINDHAKIISSYSHENITRSCGHRAEDLFGLALASNGFMPKQKKVKSYNGLEWKKTNHDLDYVFEKEISYGCEIKNTLGYIEKDELQIKLEMCKFLKIKPLFILRMAPKTYIEMIRSFGGYAMIFETQIYELSQTELVSSIKEKLHLPVDTPIAIPSGIMQRFSKWHERTKRVN